MHASQVKPNKYMVLLTVSLGTVLSGYVSSSVDIAMSNIMNAFGFTMDSVVWVLLAYMIPYGSTLPITGKLGDLFGRKKMYLGGLLLFTIATMMVGLAWSSTTLILFRMIQGIGAGFLFPNAMALVADAFPAHERGQAMGMWGAFAAAGSTLGPTVGGYIIEYMNWRVLFDSIVPISTAGLLMGITVLKESSTNNQSTHIDFLGGALLVSSLSSLLIALNQGSKEGWTSLYILGLFTATVIFMAAFIFVESRVRNPLVDLGLFRNSTFTVSNIVGFLTFMTLFGGLFLLPFFMRNILGYSPIRAGMSLFPLVGSMILLAPMGGKLADRAGSRIPVTLGMTIVTIALYSLRLLAADTAYPFIAVRLILLGAGLALTMSPLSNGVVGILPKDKIGVGSGVFNLFKNVGGSVGVAIMGTMLDNRQIFHARVLTDQFSLSSEPVRQTLGALQAGFRHGGMSDGQAQAAAMSVLNGMISRQAAVQAFDDVFLVTAALAVIGVLAAVFIRDVNKESREEAGELAAVME